MKTRTVWLVTILTTCGILFIASTFRTNKAPARKKIPFVPPKGCVFRTVMGEEASEAHSVFKTPERVEVSLTRGLDWMMQAQNKNGGWGAGDHHNQREMNPHAVTPDPATTSMAAMALLRNGNTLKSGLYHTHLRKALNFLLESTETADEMHPSITTLTGTQIQTKLGANIDVILAAQFFSNVMDHTKHDSQLYDRTQQALNKCVRKIQRSQEKDGSISGSGWAGVLQSSFATNALEAAESKGAKVDDKALEKAREYQKNNYDSKTGNVNTDKGAGIVLYSVTGSARASAKEARKVKEEVEIAKRDGRLSTDAPPSAENLEKIGYTKDQAIKYATAYEVYESAKIQSQKSDVMNGFGNNGGEEFLSYLQTGESLIIGKDNSWKKWYDDISGRLLNIQNNDGSWNGHHCITSPVFCTATCLLILSVNNDIETLTMQGK